MSELDQDYDEAEHNPFVSFLREALSKATKSPEAVESIRWTPGLWPDYEICKEEAASIVGNDARAAQAILFGWAALHEMPKGSPEQRAEWARAESDRKLPDLILDFAGGRTLDAQASDSGEAS